MVAAVIAVAGLLPQPLGWPLLVAIVILLGVPHGALDGEICRTLLRPRFGRMWFPMFAGPYLLLFGLVLICWQVAPCATLLAFLLASAWHFGSEDAAPCGGGLEILVRGGLPIVLPLLVHPAATLALLGTMARVTLVLAGWERAVGQGWLVLATLWIAAAVAGGHWRRLGEPLLLAMPFVALPPLPAFVIYFVCVHAPAHTGRLIEDAVRAPRIHDSRSAVLLALPITALTLLIGAMLWPMFPGTVSSRLVSLTFQMLAALTLPHMLLDLLLDRRDRAAARGRVTRHAALDGYPRIS